ncbi:hypothetical protein ES705_37986 [subsurface metagenome]
MKKLTVLVAVILIAGLLSGCWLFPEQSLLDYIVADPGEITLKVGETQQLTITAWYEDGTSANVTSDCDYFSTIPGVATVDSEGSVTAVEVPWFEGDTWIKVTYCQENDSTDQRIREACIKVIVTEE